MSSKDSPHAIATNAAIRRAFLSGVIFFALVLGAGQALALDTDSASGGITLDTSPNDPVISHFDIKTGTTAGAGTSILGTQIVVGTQYHVEFAVDAPNGWSSISTVDARVWYDAGTEVAYGSQSTGRNYKASIHYANSGTDTPLKTQFAATDGNLIYDDTTSVVGTVVSGSNYTFNLTFSFGNQMRAAAIGTLSATAYSNADSWNAEIQVVDTSPKTITLATENSGNYAEFGVETYTSVSLSGVWSVASSIAPNNVGTTNAVTLTRVSNFEYKLQAYLSADLVKTGDPTKTIPATDVTLVKTGNMSVDTAFPGSGSGNPVYIEGAVALFHTMDPNANLGAVAVTLKIFVPYGTSVGAYTGTVNIVIQQQTPLP